MTAKKALKRQAVNMYRSLIKIMVMMMGQESESQTQPF
jgi:hypothetical protein